MLDVPDQLSSAEYKIRLIERGYKDPVVVCKEPLY